MTRLARPRRIALVVLFALVMRGAASSPQVQAPPMPTGTNALVGRVVEMGTDAPVGGAIVTLTGRFDASGKPVAPSPQARLELLPNRSVMTTPDGTFVFRGLPAGLFTAATRAFGYMNNDFPPVTIELRDGQKPVQVQLRVWKFAAIGGRVVDERGEPVTGVPVSALQRSVSASGVRLQRAGVAVTDDRGVYRISQLPPGDYVTGVLSTPSTLPVDLAAALDPSPANRTTYSATVVELIQSGFLRTYGCETCVSNSHEGHHVAGFVLQRPGAPLPPGPDGKPLSYANTYYPATSRLDEATVVSLGSGAARTDLDVTVRFAPTVTVAGVVTGPNGPMKHMAIRLGAPGADFDDFEMSGVATAITDGRGAFAFLAMPPGEYLLTGSVWLDFNETTGAGRILWASQSLGVGDKDIAGLTVTLQPGVPVSGSVVFRGPAGITDKPPQRQVVTLQPVGAQFWRTLPAVVQPDGTFRSPGDPPGRYIMNVSSPPGWFLHTMTIGGRPLADGIIELGTDELSGFVFTFGQTTNRVFGGVSDENGAPDPDAAVIVFSADSTAWRNGIFTSRRTRKVLATSSGAYEIPSLAPGDYYLAAVGNRLALNWQDPAFLERLVAGAVRVTLDVDDEKSVSLRTIIPTRR
jgi:protocatechuate 3,4-dioxygenase beta subunit